MGDAMTDWGRMAKRARVWKFGEIWAMASPYGGTYFFYEWRDAVEQGIALTTLFHKDQIWLVG